MAERAKMRGKSESGFPEGKKTWGKDSGGKNMLTTQLRKKKEAARTQHENEQTE